MASLDVNFVHLEISGLLVLIQFVKIHLSAWFACYNEGKQHTKC